MGIENVGSLKDLNKKLLKKQSVGGLKIRGKYGVVVTV